MSVKITGSYVGNKKVDLIHAPSGVSIMTDAPKDNKGEGSCFSPSDLVAASLGSCLVTTMAIFADSNGIEIGGTKFEAEKFMHADPRRVAAISVTMHMPVELSKESRAKLEKVAATCPVHKSIHPDIKVDLKFVYDIK